MKWANARPATAIIWLATGPALALTAAGGNAQTADDPRGAWHLVQIKCPADNGGVLETRRRNELGDTQIVHVTYRDGVAIFYSLQDFGTRAFYLDYDVQFDVGTQTEEGVRKTVHGDSFARRMAIVLVSPAANKDLAHNCLSDPAERSAARAEVEANRRMFGL